MPTATKTVTKRTFSFTSEGNVQLQRALSMFFGAESLYYVLIPEYGFCVAASCDGPTNIQGVEQKWQEPTPASLETIALKATEWLRGLSHKEAMSLNTSRPNSLYAGQHLRGFKVESLRTSDGVHEMLLIIPGWV